MLQNEEKDNKTNGRWTKQQHQKFLLGVQLFGKNWKKIEELVGTRSGCQIRSHAQKFFLKDTKPKESSQAFEESHQSQRQQSPVAVITKTKNKQSNDHSYFMNKIIQIVSSNNPINFWHQFIDMKCQKLEPEIQIKRKDSFITHDSCYDSKMETAFPYLSLTTDII